MKGYMKKKRLALTFSFFFKATYDKALRVLKRAEEDKSLDTTDGGVERESPGDRHFHRRPLSTQQATSLPAPPPGLACGVFGPRASSPVATGAARSSFVFDHQLQATTSMITALSPPTNDAGRPASCASDWQTPATVPALTGCFESRVIKLLLEQRQQLRELTQQNAALKVPAAGPAGGPTSEEDRASWRGNSAASVLPGGIPGRGGGPPRCCLKKSFELGLF
ncbi:unnamed protein product [Ixodes persulcatus]